MERPEARSDRPVDVRAGPLQIRLAESSNDVEASQRLRFRVFYEEMAARPTRNLSAERRDFDSFDEYCDHLLVFDASGAAGPNCVVGTYRLMRLAAALRRGRFYSADEYDLSNLLDYSGEILELGRSCVDPKYRDGATMQLLWRGIAAYVFHYEIDILFGCASLPGVVPDRHALPLSYLHHNHLAPVALRTRARASRYVDMSMLAPEHVHRPKALRALPPLIKGYLRLGGFVGDGAVIDRQFGTTDVCIVVKTDRVTEKYYRHYAMVGSAKPQTGAS
jgi:putative hemolysin